MPSPPADDRLEALHHLMHICVLDLIITCKFLPREIIAEMVREMAWLRDLPGGEPDAG